MTKQSSKKKAARYKKKALRYIKQAKNARGKASNWIINNINPDIYNNDASFDFDPWNPSGPKSKKKNKRR